MNKFTETYKSFSNHKLLKIIEEAQSYNPEAIEAAKAELAKREVSQDEIRSAKDEILAKNLKIERRQQKIKTTRNKAKIVSSEILDTINSIETESLSTARKINMIVIFFGLWSILTIFRELYFVKFLFTDMNFGEWDFSAFAVILPLILMPLTTLLFWRRCHIGWILVSVFLIYGIGSAIGGFILDWRWYHMEPNSLGNLQNEINEILPSPGYIKYFIYTAIFSATLWVVSKADIRAALEVDKKTAWATILSATGLMLIILFGL